MQSGTVFIPLWICILYAFVLSTNSIVLLIRIKTIITIHLAKSTKN